MSTAQNGQTHWNNLSTVADELFECVWSFCGIGAWRVKFKKKKLMTIIFNDYYVSSILKLSDKKGSSVDRVNQIKIENKIWK